MRLWGTTFNPLTAKHSRQELELWLRLKLSKNAEFRFIIRTMVQGKPMVVLRIWPAAGYPVSFDGTEYIRSGTSTQPVAKNSQREQRLWEITKSESFEDQIALQWLHEDEALIRCWTGTDTSSKPIPLFRQAGRRYCIFWRPIGIVKQLDSGQYAVTNPWCAAVRNGYAAFPYSRTQGVADHPIRRKPAFRAEPQQDMVGRVCRYGTPSSTMWRPCCPSGRRLGVLCASRSRGIQPLAVRELVANMLIHQDLTIRGAGASY